MGEGGGNLLAWQSLPSGLVFEWGRAFQRSHFRGMCGRGWRGRGGFPLGNYFREETRGLRRRPPYRDEGFGLGGGWFGAGFPGFPPERP